MKPGERIELIERCARRLAAGRDWADIDFILNQFDLPWTDQWSQPDVPDDRAKFLYVREMLGNHWKNEQLLALDEYLSGDPESDPGDAPWEHDTFRLFLTHIAAEKGYATELKRSLTLYGIDAFVAHEDIQPGAEWRLKIEAALHSCDALVGILHTGVRESDWCDQEVGIVIGRGRPVIPLKMDLDPYGFFGAVQAVKGAHRAPKEIAAEIVTLLIRDKRTSQATIEALVRQLVAAHSFGQANTLARLLADHADLVDREQLERMQEARKTNGQVEGAWDVEGALKTIEAKLPPRAQSPVNYDEFGEEPF